MDVEITKAYTIALKALKECSNNNGYYAALNRYKNYWARDSFFASYGGLSIKDYSKIKKMLLFYLKYQKKSGHLPRLVPRNKIFRFIFMNIEKIFDNPFTTPFLSYFSIDQNSLFVMASWNYIKKTNDIEFAKKYFNNFEKAVNWNFKHDLDKDLLLQDQGFSDWQDSIKKKNPQTFFTNLCNYKALLCLSKISELIGKKIKKRQYNYMAMIVKEQLNLNFWTGNFYADSIKSNENAINQENPIFAGGANMLAIIWGIADKIKSIKIFDYIKEHNLEHFSIEVNYPRYQDKNVLFLFKMLGIKDYHNGMVWLWIGCIGVIAYLKINQKEKAMHLLKKIARKINEYNEVYEVYEPTGEPVNRKHYKSAKPFAWSAGLFIYAVNYTKNYKKK
jgi:glycogen debranching enzyme